MTIRGQKTILLPRTNNVKDQQTREVLNWILQSIEEINRVLRADIKRTDEYVPDEDDQSFYLGTKKKESTDPHAEYNWQDGDWRIRQTGGKLQFEKKVSGTWVRKGAIIP